MALEATIGSPVFEAHLGENTAEATRQAQLAQQYATLAGQAGDAAIVRSWSDLSGETGSPGASAIIFEDPGTHTDPVVGGTVANAGIYQWSASPAGWERIADTEAARADAFAGQASGFADDAATAKTGAETAQGLAEDARDAALGAQANAEQAVVDAGDVVQAVSDALAVGTISDLVGTRIYASRSALEADLVPADDEYALVVGDATPANNDLYQKNGATTTGSWDGPLGFFAAASALAQAWAEGTEPDGPGTFSAKEWAAEAEAFAEPIAGITPLFDAMASNNIYTPIVGSSFPTNAKAGALYNNTNGMEGALSYFGTSGIITGLTPGQVYTFNIALAPTSVTFSTGQGVFHWNSDNSYNSQSYSGAGVTFSNGNRTATFTAVTTKASFNLVNSPTSSPMSDVWAAVTSVMMVNAGGTALPYEPPGDRYVPGPAFEEASFDTSADVKVYSDGAGYYYVRTKWSDTIDRCARYRFGLVADATTNNLWDTAGERLIDRATSVSQTAAAWAVSTDSTRGGGDEGPPVQIGVTPAFLAGNHAHPLRRLTITAHGFVNGDAGSIWTDGVRQRALVAIVDANTVRMSSLNTSGDDNLWSIFNAAVSGTTLTHVSGGVATGTRTVSADVADQAYPGIRSRSGSADIDGKDNSSAGAYAGSVQSFAEQYEVPNPAKGLNHIVANNGSTIINAAVPSQLKPAMTHSVDWTGAVRTVWSLIDGEAYTPVSYGGAQSLRPDPASGGSLMFYIPRAASFAQSAVTYDFENGVDLQSNSASFEFDPAKWADPDDPPNAVFVVVKDSGGNPIRGLGYVLDDTVGQGKPSYRSGLGRAILISSIEKIYIDAGGASSSAVAGELHEAVNYVGSFNPALAPDLTWLFPYPKGGKVAYSARAPSALANYWMPVDPRLIGKPITITRDDNSVVTLHSDVVNKQGVRLSWSGAGHVELVIG